MQNYYFRIRDTDTILKVSASKLSVAAEKAENHTDKEFYQILEEFALRFDKISKIN